MSEQTMLTSEEAAKVLRTSKQTLAFWRFKKRGPAYVKIGGEGRVFYELSELERFKEASRVVPSCGATPSPEEPSTGDTPAGPKRRIMNLRLNDGEDERYRSTARAWAFRIGLPRPEERFSDWARACLNRACEEEELFVKPSADNSEAGE